MSEEQNNHYSTRPGHTYCLTATGPCSATTVINGQTVTLLSLAEGQGTFVAPAQEVIMQGSGHLTLCFNHAAPAAQGGGEHPAAPAGEPLLPATGSTPQLPLQHAVWVQLNPAAAHCCLTPAAAAGRVHSMQLLLTPAADMPAGWLTSADPALPVHWPYGEPQLAGGFRYCVTVVQLPWGILANMTPLGAQPNA